MYLKSFRISLLLLLFLWSSFLGFGRRRNEAQTILNSAPVLSTKSNAIDPVLLDIAQQVDSTRIYSTLERLEAFNTRYAGSASGRDSLSRARDWLIEQFTIYGYSDILQHTFTQGGNQLQNIIVTKTDRKSTRLNSSHVSESRMPSSA